MGRPSVCSVTRGYYGRMKARNKAAGNANEPWQAKAFGELVRYVRIKRNLTPRQLANLIGAESTTSVTMTETGNRRNLEYLFAICRELGISITFRVRGVSVPATLAATLIHAFDFTELEDAQQAILLAETTATHMAENDLFDQLDPLLEAQREEGLPPAQVRALKGAHTRYRNRFYARTETPDDSEDYSA